MPVREFTDSHGVEWRAWEVAPDAIHPPTRGEDYLADCYQLGWVVMETKAGDRRVRLCPIPAGWHRLPVVDLEALIARGEGLPAREPSGPWPASAPPVVRSFRYPGGRVWTVSLATHPRDPATRLLRFSAGGRAVDLDEYPVNWEELADTDLVSLLRRAWPRPSVPATPGGLHRRWDDPRP
jgi:hypothetical protein